MRILIFGGNGMLGHKLWQRLSSMHDVHVTTRQPIDSSHYPIFDPARVLSGVSAEDLASCRQAVKDVAPQVVINCIGIVKQLEAGRDAVVSIEVNALFPHQLARLCRKRGARLVHISTDCVFSGRRGNYSEADEADAKDLYGRTKLLGEVTDPGCLTIRTSMIGRELATSHGLVEWFLAQRGCSVRGYRRAIFSGLTTWELSGVIGRILAERPNMEGLWHVAAESVSKYDLLRIVRDVHGVDVRIEPDDALVCNRSLDGSRFRAVTGIAAPSWLDMIRQMREDPTPYEAMRQ